MPYKYPRPVKYKLKIKRGISGLGLFAEEPIKRGDFVIEYVGSLLSEKQADKKGGLYLFAVLDTPWTIDGSSRKNLARYINHSCKPNCEAIADGKRMFIHAKRAIKEGEELTYDYGKDYMEDIIKEGKCRCGNH